MKLANTKRINEKIMEIVQTKQALDIINAVTTNEVSNSIIDPEMLKVMRHHSEEYYSQMDDSFRENHIVEQVMVRLYMESYIEALIPGQ